MTCRVSTKSSGKIKTETVFYPIGLIISLCYTFCSSHLTRSKSTAVFFLTLLFAGLHIHGHSQIIARVGSHEITSKQLSETVETISDIQDYQELGYLERREIALNQLIREQLLYNYALESKIEVTENEVEQFFVVQYGNHPRLMTNGVFDRQKFSELKRNPEIRNLLVDLRKELLIHKTESILINRFRYNDNTLMDRFLLENTEIDISYALIKEETVNFPFFINPYDVLSYYHENRDNFPAPKKARVSFFIVPHHLFEGEVDVTAEEIDAKIGVDQESSSELRSETEQSIKSNKIRERTKGEALMAISELKSGQDINFPLLTTEIYLNPYHEHNRNSVFVRHDLVNSVQNSKAGDYSSPFYTDYGYLVFRVDRVETEDKELSYPSTLRVWQGYTKNIAKNRFRDQLEDYYRRNINDLIVPAAHITRMVIDKEELRAETHLSAREMRQFYEQNRSLFPAEVEKKTFAELQEIIEEEYLGQQIQELRKWCEDNVYSIGYDLKPREIFVHKNGVEVANQLIFLEQFPNEGSVNKQISEYIAENPNYQTGSYDKAEHTVFYRINSYFPAYMPNYDDIEGFLFEQAGFSLVLDEEVYRDYYEQHISSFTTSDSLKLAGIFVPVVPDTIKVEEEEVRKLYLDRQNQLKSEFNTVLHYVYISDPQVRLKALSQEIFAWLKQGVDPLLLQYSFGKDLIYPQGEPYPVNQMPQDLQSVVSGLRPGDISQPQYYEEGWYIFQKIRDIQPRQLSYNEVQALLRKELKRDKAEVNARDLAQQIFIEINRVRELYAFKDSTKIFTTDLVSANDSFGPLGDISHYKQRLMQLRRNEKLNTVFFNDDGYSVVFLLEKREGEQLAFEEAFTAVQESYDSEKRAVNSQNFVTQLRELILSGADPDSVLIFWGGWRSEKNLSYDCIVPGIQYSNLIVENAVRRNVGEVSHVIKNGDGEYTFYRLDRKHQAGTEEFRRNRDHFREYVADTDFRRWLEDYRQRVGVEIF
jgi:parvulin-like peptidyl-prolyl isomerase